MECENEKLYEWCCICFESVIIDSYILKIGIENIEEVFYSHKRCFDEIKQLRYRNFTHRIIN
jgi:hypothetical protein